MKSYKKANDRLYEIAGAQQGYFTTKQAITESLKRGLLSRTEIKKSKRLPKKVRAEIDSVIKEAGL